MLSSLGLREVPVFVAFRPLAALISLFVYDKASEMQISHCWHIRHECAPSYLLGSMAWLVLVRNDFPQGTLTWATSMKACVPLADGCFIPTRQVDFRTAANAISNV